MNKNETTSTETASNSDIESQESQDDNVTPLRCLIGSAISGGIAYILYLLMNSIALTYAVKTVTSTNPVVINLTAAVRTMVIGIVALAVGVVGLVSVGLLLLGIQVTVESLKRRITKTSN
jgi:predicted RND superfamily exporter protein